MPAPSPLAFAASALDRCANHRTDADWLERLRQHPQSVMVQLKGDAALIVDNALDLQSPAGSPDALLLGLAPDGRAWFASPTTVDEGLVGLRSLALAGTLAQAHLDLLAQARSLLHWHERHGFCANCGQPTEIRDAGYRRHCPACSADHFPRTDPVVIVAVVHGQRMLLGRQSSWPEGMYSTLAGFMEPGETIETAARREVFEEAGIRLGAVHFHANQPWPFPSSLMIGLLATALNDDIVIDPKELETARWFDFDEVGQMLDGSHPAGLNAPKPMAIAHHLIVAALQSSAADKRLASSAR